ncbi:hypothetical protein MBLNU230_g0365t1 [Neophaeotheca triangularis]
MAAGARRLPELSGDPKLFADCCVGISEPMIETLRRTLPDPPALILSIGCGSGLLEALLVERGVNVCGVEVPSCENKYLALDRLLRVPTAQTLHQDAILASTLLFVYPRSPELVRKYADHFAGGALESVLWLGHQMDKSDYQEPLRSAFDSLTVLDAPSMFPYECLFKASKPRGQSRPSEGIEH